MIDVDLDLTDPGVFSATLEQYLSHGVCPAHRKPMPPFFSDVKLRAMLPGGFEVYWTGRVIRLLSTDTFLVELSPPPSLVWLKTLLSFGETPKPKPAVAEASAAEPAPQNSSAVPRPAPALRTTAQAAPAASTASAAPASAPAAQSSSPSAPAAAPPGGASHTTAQAIKILVEENTEDEDDAPPEAGHSSDEFATAGASETTGAGFLNAPPEHTSPDLLFAPLPESQRTGEWTKDPNGSGSSWINEWAQRTGSGAAAFQSSGSWPAGLALEESSSFIQSEITGQVSTSSSDVIPVASTTAQTTPRTAPGQHDTPELRAKIASLTLEQKRQVARKGGKAARKLLVNDPEKSLHALVILNPEIGLEEVEEYSQLPALSAEAIRHIVHNRSWMNSRAVVFNLVRNPSTPLDIAAALCAKLGPTEWKFLMQAPDVKTPVAAVARKLLLKSSI